MSHAPEQFHTSEARAPCMIHAIDKLVPQLVPILADTISAWIYDLGLDSTIMDDEEAAGLALQDETHSP